MRTPDAAIRAGRRARFGDWSALARAASTDPAGAMLIRRVRCERLTYLGAAALLDLRRAVRRADREGRAGSLIECGCALGGSAVVLGASRIDTTRPVYVHDVFGMIPPPGDMDGDDVRTRYHEIVSGAASGLGGDLYYGYRDGLLEEVKRTFARYGLTGVHTVEGLFEDTLHPTGPVAVAHIDGDWYESVMVCLERVWPRLVPSGVIVVDDYFDWSGCRRAVDDFTRGRADCRRVLRARLQLVKG